MKRLPTDIEILNKIYDDYYEIFKSFTKDKHTRETKIYVPIDIHQIAKELKVDDDIIFGRLYYHLENKYGYKNDDKTSVHLFTLMAGKDRHCINYPYAASILADLRDANKKYQAATAIAVLSLFISLVSILLAIFL